MLCVALIRSIRYSQAGYQDRSTLVGTRSISLIGCSDSSNPLARDPMVQRDAQSSVTNLNESARIAAAAKPGRRGFTLVDVLVSLAIVSLLIAIFVPSIQMVRESTRRIVCANNARQVALGVALYADANRELLPPSVFALKAMQDPTARPEQMVYLRLDNADSWDGLGLLFKAEILTTPGVFYCPSHTGDQGYSVYRDRWVAQDGEIQSNYHYRGAGNDGQRRMSLLTPRLALVADAMRTMRDYNHKTGVNVARVDLSVEWFADNEGNLARRLFDPSVPSSPSTPARVSDAWDMLDSGNNSGGNENAQTQPGPR